MSMLSTPISKTALATVLTPEAARATHETLTAAYKAHQMSLIKIWAPGFGLSLAGVVTAIGLNSLIDPEENSKTDYSLVILFFLSAAGTLITAIGFLYRLGSKWHVGYKITCLETTYSYLKQVAK